jgi:hypothetical protein
MANLAQIEVALAVRVQVVLRAENATGAELAAWAERHPDDVRGALVTLLERPNRLHREVEAGWLDEDRAVFLMEIVAAEVQGDDVPEVVA